MPYVCPLLVPDGLFGALRSERFAFLPRATEPEVDLAGTLGLQCAGLPRLVVRDWIESAVQLVLGRYGDRPATAKQIALALRGGLDVDGCSSAVARPACGVVVRALSLEAVKLHALARGTVITFRQHFDGETYSDTGEISSFSSEGRIYFRGGMGRQAWAYTITKEGELYFIDKSVESPK